MLALGSHVPSAASSAAWADKTLRPAMDAQVLQAVLFAAELRLELLNRKNAPSFQSLRSFMHASHYIVFCSPDQTSYSSHLFLIGNSSLRFFALPPCRRSF